jgi:tetratricopeptide (TPR) repeat protein/transcriptional regulator with XRE-family HTH domain
VARSLARIVRTLRERVMLSQEELAARSGLSVSTVRGIEAGRIHRPRPASVRLLADVLATSEADREQLLDVTHGLLDGGPDDGLAPAQLPPDVSAFTGREDQLAQLDAWLAGDTSGPAAVVISAIAGTAGVGKTALAIRWAHRAAGRYPDGQLYVNLRGYDLDQPVTAAEALARFLAALGVPSQNIPAGVDERAARYRTELAGRRMLIVLDNAAAAEQVRPLLPGTPSCTVVVTSRNSLAGLVAVDGARRMDLDLLPVEEAITLLRTLIGDRVNADPDAAAAMAEQCARLPLALRVAAELAITRPAIPLAKLVAELTDQRRRLDLLAAGGDPRASVAAVFSWSLRHLPDDATRTFRLLGVDPAPDIDVYAAAALIGADVESAHRLLDALTRAHLVQPTGPGRYAMHDLLRAYAAHRATVEEPEPERQAALRRLFDFYVAGVSTVSVTLYPVQAQPRQQASEPVSAIPDLADPDTARSWLDAERHCLVAVAGHASALGWHNYAVKLAEVLYHPLKSRGHYLDALAIYEHAVHSAEQVGDEAVQARALMALAGAHERIGSQQTAFERLTRALALFRDAGNRSGQGHALTSLGVVGLRQGDYASATGFLHRAVALLRDADDRPGQGHALTNLGVVGLRQGDYASATGFLHRAVALFRDADDRPGQAHALTNLGVVALRRGDHASATELLNLALTLFQQARDPFGQACALDNLGAVALEVNEVERSAEHRRQALQIFQDIGDRNGEAWVLNGLGEAARAIGDWDEAHSLHAAALTIAIDVAARDQQARAHTGLGHCLRVQDDLTQARTHYAHALSIYTDLDMPDAEDVRAHLTLLD